MNLLNLAQKLKIFSFLAVETLTKVELPWNLKLFWLVETTTMRPHWRKSRSRKRNSWSRQLQSWSGTNHSRSWTHRGQSNWCKGLSHWCKGLSSTRTADGLPRISRQEVCYGEPRARRLANSIGIGVWIIWSPEHPTSGLKRWRRRWSCCSCLANLKIKNSGDMKSNNFITRNIWNSNFFLRFKLFIRVLSILHGKFKRRQ